MNLTFKQVIIIFTKTHRLGWLNTVMKSLENYHKYPIIVFAWEYHGLPRLLNFLTCDEFVLLHDSMEITDTRLFDVLFEEHRGRSVAFFGSANQASIFVPYCMGLGKYKYDLIKKLKIPDIKDKKADMAFEYVLGNDYFKLAPDTVTLFNDTYLHQNEIVSLNGRQNKKFATPYFIKYQGHWGEPTEPPNENFL